MRLPVDYYVITSHHGFRTDPFGSGQQEFHDGIDFKSTLSNKVFSPCDAIVSYDMDNYDEALRWSDRHHSGGNMIIVDFKLGNTLFHMRFLHLIENVVSVGHRLKESALIGFYGDVGRSKGPHLHNDLYIQSVGGWQKIDIEAFYKNAGIL